MSLRRETCVEGSVGGDLSVVASAMTLSIDGPRVSSADAVAMVVMKAIESALIVQSCQQTSPETSGQSETKHVTAD